VGIPFAAETLGMNADDQHFLIIGAVEDADPAAFRQVAAGSPEKIVLQFRDTSVPLLTDDSQIGANLQVCTDEENRADWDQRG